MKRKAEQHSRHKEFLEEVLNSLTFPFYVVDVNTHQIQLSNPTARCHGIPDHATCFSLFHKRDRPCETSERPCPIEEMKKTKKSVVIEHMHDDPYSISGNIEVHGHPIFDRTGNVVRAILYFFDITRGKTLAEMAERYNYIVDTAKEFMTLIDRTYTYEAVNASYCTALNKKREEIIGRTVAEIWGKNWTTIEPYLRECFEGNDVCYEAWFEFPGLGLRYFEVSCYPYYDDEGSVTHVVTVTQDITERKKCEDALRLSERKFSSAFHLSPERISIVTLKDGRYIDVNEAFLRSSGYDRSEVINRTSTELGIWAYPGERAEMVKLLSEKGALSNKEVFLRNKSGAVLKMLWSAEVIVYGDEPCIVSVTRDITELKQTEEELLSVILSLKQRLLEDRLEHEDAFSSIVTKSKKMRAIFQYVEIIARSPQPVLITGETGVGKELVAKVIHELSGREGAIVAVNVAGLDDVMFSDTLFGHRKGAYTGADQARDGLVAQASRGTLFLDEIGDLKEPSQVKLLRLLQDRTYYPLGSDTSLQTDTRVIVTTNRDIQGLMAGNTFRKDLYYRLRFHQIHIPPLRERREDIPPLLDHLLGMAARSLSKQKPAPPAELFLLLAAYDFPGNVREFQAMVFDAVARHRSGKLSIDSFREAIGRDVAGPEPLAEFSVRDRGALSSVFGRFPTLKEVEHHAILEALKQANGNQGIAAALLGMTRQALNKRLNRTPQFRDHLKG